MKVRLSSRSRADLAAILDYLRERNPAGARNVARAAARVFRLIGEYPMIGHLSGEQDSRVLPVGRYPYLVYWIVREADVYIVHIRHAAREPWTPAQ